MQINATPFFDQAHYTTGCCATSNPEGWDEQMLHFDKTPLVRATTRSLVPVPLNMGAVFSRVQEAIDDTGTRDPTQEFVLSRDSSALGRFRF